MVAFYNQADQDLYKKYQYLPQEQYRLGLNLPKDPVTPPVSGGITNTNAFNNSGGGNDGFSSTGNVFGYGSPVSEVNVRTFNPQSNDPTGSVANAQLAYNQLGDIKDKSIYSNYADINNQIMDNRQNYGAQGQYNSPYEDSMDLGYQGTLGNNEMYPSEKYPNSFMKGKLNRFRNTAGDVMKFAGGLLPFPLNLATKFLPQGNDNGPGGGTYGIGGLSDNKKAAYNALAGQGYLFDGQQGFKTLTGKNFQATNYVPNQLKMYEKLKDEEELTGFQKKQLLEASAVYKATEKQNKEAKAAADAKAVADAKAAVTMQTNNFVPPSGTPGGGRAYDYDGRSNQYGTHDSTISNKQAQDNQDRGRGQQDTESQTNSQAGGGGFYDFAKGGRAGYFFGGRVNYKAGGRTDAGPNRTTASKAGVGQINESGQKVSGGNFNNNDGGGGNNPSDFFVEDKTSIVDNSRLLSKSPEISVDYTDPKNFASLKSRVYNTNILDNDNINVDGTLSGEIGPVNYDVNFTDQGITGTDLTAGNFSAGIDANKNYNVGYANNYNGIDYGTTYDSDGNLMFNAGVRFKNGGLAGLL